MMDYYRNHCNTLNLGLVPVYDCELNAGNEPWDCLFYVQGFNEERAQQRAEEALGVPVTIRLSSYEDGRESDGSVQHVRCYFADVQPSWEFDNLDK